MSYLHNIVTDRDSRIDVDAQTARFGVQVAIGTAPVNLLENPSKAVNVPLAATSMGEVEKLIGVCDDYTNYTLMQTAFVSFRKFAVAPVVFINVLDPNKSEHKTAVAAASKNLTSGSVKIEDKGILLGTLAVTYGEEDTTATANTDYIASFDDDGYVDIAVTPTGAIASATAIKVSYSKLNPSGVTASDIVGGVSAAGVKTGISLVDEVYTRLGIIPSVLTAPGFSSNASVIAALEAKAQLAGDIVNGIAVVDIPASGDYTTVETQKNNLGLNSRWITACYPKVKIGSNIFCMSAVVAALLQNLCIANDDIPSSSQDNKEVPIDGVCLDGGTEVYLKQSEANDYIVAKGVVTCIRLGKWKCWGSNTTAYPQTIAPNDRFTKCVQMSNYLENRFKTEYLSKLGNNGSTKEMDSIVTDYNASLNALVPDHLAGARIVFNKSDNPMSEIIEGRWHFHTYYADWIPTEYIENQFTWDSSILEDALSTEGE